ncbi:type III secretion protein [Pseudomonas sp. 18.1.10]|uniref:type III secretion protein n=1 Tax=Pseudomonas sp. 18.1.10 TaxID=2969302 RepID=UPI00215009C5|nr:type III secretion protein [Pseudomonas sp. 18.1.10]MCR4538169.1 type III secretion protein [Pseudomonas sp. 18.1.10]
MDFFKEQTHQVSRNKTSAYKDYESGFEESLAAGDSDFFFHLVERREATFMLYNDFNKTVNQILKTTIESFP